VRQEIGLFKIGFIRHKERALERLVLGVTEAFGGFFGPWLSLKIPRDGFGRFLCGFRVGRGFGALWQQGRHRA
jgi:hypothetical protein